MIFVDTSFWVALRNRRDPHHPEAARLLGNQSEAALFTTNHVCGETWTYLRRKSGHGSAVGFLDSVERSPRVVVFHVTEELERQAVRWLRQHSEREYSFVDATSFAVMRAQRIREVLAFDGDFSAAGFIELRVD
jgi:predicted nucleic acid-binding protein